MLVNIQDESGNFIGQGVDILPHDDGKESENVHTGVDSSNEFRSNPSTSSQNYSRVDVLRGGGSGLNDNEDIGELYGDGGGPRLFVLIKSFNDFDIAEPVDCLESWRLANKTLPLLPIEKRLWALLLLIRDSVSR